MNEDKRDFKGFIKELIKRSKADKIQQVGAQLAYYLLMSLFPLVIFVLSILSFTSLGQEESLSRLLSALPAQTAELLQPVLLDLVNNRSGSILGLSLFLSLWSGSNGLNNLINAMDAAYDIENARQKLLRRVISVGYTILLALVIVVALAIQVFGDQIYQALLDSFPDLQIGAFWQLIQYLLPLLIIILSLALLYKWGPGFPENKFITFKEALLGATVAGVLWTLASMLFGLYVSQFANYSKTYGSLGGVIVLMIWLYLSSVIIMIGVEVTATYISRYKGGLERNVRQAIAEHPEQAAEAGTMVKKDDKTVVRPLQVQYVSQEDLKPLYKKKAFYIGSALGTAGALLYTTIRKKISGQ